MTYGDDPGSGGTPPYGSQPEPSTPYGEPSRPRGRPIAWTLGALAVLAATLFGIYSCSDGGGPGTTPSTPTPVVYPPPTTPTTPTTVVDYPPTVVTDEPPTYVRPPVVTAPTPVTTTTAAPKPPTSVNAGSGGEAGGDRGGTVGLVLVGLIFVAVALTALLRRRRHIP